MIEYEDPIKWLLQSPEPSIRYLTLRDVLDRPAEDAELGVARAQSYQSGAMAALLKEAQPEGWWVKPGPGYSPKYRSTVWAVLLLAQLGAQVGQDERVQRACDYLLDHALAAGGQFSYNGTPQGTFDCLQGNLIWSMIKMGCADARLEAAVEWMARSTLGEGLASSSEPSTPLRYYKYKSGPDFRCGANHDQPCAWGAVKVMLAFSALAPAQRTPLVERAIARGVAFLFSAPLLQANWPGTSISGEPRDSWWQFSFPQYYQVDLLQAAEALTALGYARDLRLRSLMQLIRSKKDEQGRWLLDSKASASGWLNPGRVGKPNAWITLRALRVLKAASGEDAG